LIKRKYILLVFSILLFVSKSSGQTHDFFKESFSEQTSTEDKFAIYLDTIDKYLYRDSEISKLAFQECKL